MSMSANKLGTKFPPYLQGVDWEFSGEGLRLFFAGVAGQMGSGSIVSRFNSQNERTSRGRVFSLPMAVCPIGDFIKVKTSVVG